MKKNNHKRFLKQLYEEQKKQPLVYWFQDSYIGEKLNLKADASRKIMYDCFDRNLIKTSASDRVRLTKEGFDLFENRRKNFFKVFGKIVVWVILILGAISSVVQIMIGLKKG